MSVITGAYGSTAAGSTAMLPYCPAVTPLIPTTRLGDHPLGRAAPGQRRDRRHVVLGDGEAHRLARRSMRAASRHRSPCPGRSVGQPRDAAGERPDAGSGQPGAGEPSSSPLLAVCPIAVATVASQSASPPYSRPGARRRPRRRVGSPALAWLAVAIAGGAAIGEALERPRPRRAGGRDGWRRGPGGRSGRSPWRSRASSR